MSNLRDLLMGLHREHGHLTPALVVDAATPEDSPLHRYFDWDDSSAAHKWRIEQAREHIRSVRIRYVENDKPKTTRAFVSVRDNDSAPSNYQPTEQIAQDPLAMRIVLRDFERKLRDLKAEYGHLKEFHDLVQQHLQGGTAA